MKIRIKMEMSQNAFLHTTYTDDSVTQNRSKHINQIEEVKVFFMVRYIAELWQSLVCRDEIFVKHFTIIMQILIVLGPTSQSCRPTSLYKLKFSYFKLKTFNMAKIE
jgi:hypothetical protein